MFEIGKTLPSKVGEFPPSLFGRPIEDLDDYYRNKYVRLLLLLLMRCLCVVVADVLSLFIMCCRLCVVVNDVLLLFLMWCCCCSWCVVVVHDVLFQFLGICFLFCQKDCRIRKKKSIQKIVFIFFIYIILNYVITLYSYYVFVDMSLNVNPVVVLGNS